MRWFSGFLSLLALFVLTACNSATPIPNDTLVIGIETFPEQPDPRKATDAISSKVNKLIYSGLLVTDEHQNLVGDLAATFKATDAQTYSLTLRPGITFHNGQPLTSADVLATYQSMLEAATASPFRASLGIINRIETPDTNSLVFHLKEPYQPFPSLLTLGILPATLAQEKMLPGGKPIGTGPYRFVAAADGKEWLRLAAFENYHGGKAKTPNLRFRVIQDGTLRALELMKGRIDLVQNGIPFALISYLKKQPQLKFTTETGVNFSYLAFNFQNHHLKDLRVRQAIALAIDRKKLINYKLAGLAQPADSLLNPLHWAYAGDLPQQQLNIQAARLLLDQTPFVDPDGDGPETRFTLVYKTSTVKERLEIAQLIAESLGQIGINVEVKPYEFGTFYRDIRQGNFDLFTLTWVGLSDPDIYYQAFHSTQIPPVGSNRGYYVNPQLDKLLDRSRREPDAEQRTKVYQAVQKIIATDLVYVPLWYESNFVFVGKNVTGYRLRPDAGFQNLAAVSKNQ